MIIIIIILSSFPFAESMEIIPEGKNFRLLHDDELNDVLEELEKYMPEALKVGHFRFYFTFTHFDVLVHIKERIKVVGLCHK